MRSNDGAVVTCPCEPLPGYIYQKLIRNEDENGSVKDIRTSITGNEISLVCFRYRSVNDRFDNTKRVVITNTDDAFTKAEQQRIVFFCKEFGLDHGELDILRDKAVRPQSILVDVNNTPATPRSGVQIERSEYRRFISILSNAFERSFVDHQPISEVPVPVVISPEVIRS